MGIGLWLAPRPPHPAASAAPDGGGDPGGPPGQDHDCIVGSPPPGGIGWAALHNPILSYPTYGVKDQALQWTDGQWHMLFSDMTETSAAPHVRFAVAQAVSPDLVHWSAPRIIATDAASPDIVRDPTGHFVVTYQTPTGLAARLPHERQRLAYRAWFGQAHPLGPGLDQPR